MNLPSITPSPGLVWGPYPQKDSGELLSEGRRRIARSWRRLSYGCTMMIDRSRQAQHQAAAARILRQANNLREMTDDRLTEAVDQQRRNMAVDGLSPTNIEKALALLSECSRRTLGQLPYPTQLIACRIILSNHLAEMATGEGKTLVCAISAAAAALAGIPVHVLTANDYLVERDRAGMDKLFSLVGLTSACILPGQSPDERRQHYACDVVYCTAKELVFDYLRDRVSLAMNDPEIDWQVNGLCASPNKPLMLRGLCMGIVDEADSILLDEACTPLKLSRQLDHEVQDAQFRSIFNIAKRLWVNRDFTLNSAYRSAKLSTAGKRRVEQCGQKLQELNRLHPRDLTDQIEIALASIHLFHRDRDYLVQDDGVQLIDANTGRISQGKVWSGGLQQMVEIKENQPLSGETVTIAQITYQQFFARYLRLSGLSGSLRESASELVAVYGLPVEPVALRVPSRRKLNPPQIFPCEEQKWRAVIKTVSTAQQCGRPVLVGVASVEQAEFVSGLLKDRGMNHQVLSAGNDRDEAAIVSNAGRINAVTIATNMAGRGTDISIDKSIAERGGLLLIACHHNDERRIDRQLFGRTARHGQPGQILRFASLDNDFPPAMLKPLSWLCRVNSDKTLSGIGGTAAQAALHLKQRLIENRRRRLRLQLLETGVLRDRLLAPSGLGE